MELKESVMMDITDAFHGEDIKTDFFDFVVSSAAAAAAAAAAASENNNNNHNHHQEDDDNQHHNNNNHHQHLQHMQQFAKQMRTVNAFLEGADHHNINNHQHHEVNIKQEPNNNNNDSTMLMSEVVTATATTPTAAASPQNVTNFDATFWNDKETVRIETAILEDLNRYWSSEEANGGADVGSGIGIVEIGSPSRNGASSVADGQIYTLTVLNGIDQSATWYRPPKEEEVSVSSPGSMEHLHGAGLDIDSILNIMPGQMGGYNNNFGDATMSPSNTDGLIKSETYTFEDRGFADNKDELTSTLIIDTPLLEAHDSFSNNNNNNDWKLTNNNTTTATPAAGDGSPDSLLRSALQGKTYGVRYNGGAKSSKGESNTELRRVLSTPPGKTEPVYLKEEQADHIPTIVAGIDANGKVVFEEHVSPRISQDSAENNPSSTHSVDDLLLSQLDHPFPEDFEKLKRIANEVAESVSQYCQIDASGESSSISPIGNNQIGILYSLTSPIQIATPVTAAASSSKPPKKYKRQTSASKSNQSSVQTATSTSNGVRKERSLHYCSICSKGFKDKYSVNVHIRTHTGEKPFACNLCGKSFRQKAHLAKHYQTHIAQKNAAAAGGGGGGGGGTIAATAATKAKSR